MMRGMNMQQMMKQAKKMQQKMMEEQQNLAKEEFIGVSPDEMVKATFTGDKKLTDLQIDPQAVDPDDVDMLADLVLAAVNDGLEKVDAVTQQKFGKYTKGLNI